MCHYDLSMAMVKLSYFFEQIKWRRYFLKFREIAKLAVKGFEA